MSSESSKIEINSVTPEVQVSRDVNGVQQDDGLFSDNVNKPTAEEVAKESQQNSKEKKNEKHTAPHQSANSSPEIQQEEGKEENNVSATLKETEEKLKTCGFTDPVLAQYCDKTPELFEEFVKLYEAVKTIRRSLHCKDFVSPVTSNLNTVYCLLFINVMEEISTNKNILLGNLLAALGFGEVCRDLYDKLVATFPKILSYDREMDQEDRDDEILQPHLKAQECMKRLCAILINYTDRSDDLCVAVSEAGLISRLLDMIENMKDCIPHHTRFMDEKGVLRSKTTRGAILLCVLGALHNMSKRVQTRATFAKCNAVAIHLTLIDNEVLDYAANALLTLAYLTDDSNNEQIMANEGPIKFLISLLEKAITCSSNHKFLGFTSEELADGLAQIAVNDDNKKTIADNNAIPISKKMLKNAMRDEERIAAINLLWVLAFDEGNKAKMRQTKGLVTLLKSWKTSENNNIEKAASGALWEIEGKQGLESSKDAKLVETESKKHVMISYQWDVQETIIQVKDKLQSAGFKVWMDLEQMGGSTLEAMAKAVENSAVVIVGVSQKYKESSNCRSEAEYAFQLKKDIVPLMMQSNYKADGWLGMLMGSKLWFDFSQGQQEIDDSVKALVKELGSRGKVESEDSAIEAINVDTVDAVPDQTPKTDISGWTNKDVMEWIQTLRLEMKKKNALQELTGSMLMQLHHLKSECPGYYYSSLKEDFGLDNVCSVFKFTHELEKLLQ